ncbi:hypothetical protein ALO68_101657 [Pseudomonas syringae pv. helianthi]|uniref:Uncharacterized protein n=3 Tax=Pseudomonas syringae group TaxID=136849 RepID=A0A0P9SBI6_9PSED|nr:hypothetical protein ALO68_101657 [Pseudomonas syringae pv. helianthi]KPY82993.1 hypothetical protein ALO44_101547 [Pseudomonas syringae pv. tagetis]RMV78362.1 hypothetical protein ALP05_101581 [Pseudomonas caricapapayae]RMR04730.1 hypothetical protein ALP93_101225 [Pseudomonas syringae pv. helianthi]RMV47790.1 hypothetical protein ALP10_101416 [Pseudomonas syringae pv. helianthi]
MTASSAEVSLLFKMRHPGHKCTDAALAVRLALPITRRK